MSLLEELLRVTEKELSEAKRAFKRKGNKITRGVRCTAGKRKGRVVKTAADCFKKKDIKRAMKARLSARRTKFVRARKSKLTRRKSASKIVSRLNKASKARKK